MTNKKNKITTIWFTGLSASGKTSLSERLFDSLSQLGINNIVLLDGEAIRDELQNYKFDSQNREQIGIQKAKIALDLNSKGKIVLISGIAHKKQGRREIRGMFNNYYEIFLDCKVEECIKRDFKGQYKKSISGSLPDFIGISEPYEISDEYDLRVNTSEQSIEVCSKLILDCVLSHLRY
jgi:adenylylsulfate kinase-like enzyme